MGLLSAQDELLPASANAAFVVSAVIVYLALAVPVIVAAIRDAALPASEKTMWVVLALVLPPLGLIGWLLLRRRWRPAHGAH